MSKYDLVYNNKNSDIKDIIVEGENIIWEGKPKKSAYIVNETMKMLPIAIIWLLVDSFFIINLLKSEEFSSMLFLIIPFFAIHLMPVWIWLSNIFTASKRWENTTYAVTDKRIIIISGFIGMDYQTIYYKDINKVYLRVGVIDKILKVGDIYFNVNPGKNVSFLDIEAPQEIYPKLQKIVLDIQTDIEFPNNLRPKDNDGYNTEYNPKN